MAKDPFGFGTIGDRVEERDQDSWLKKLMTGRQIPLSKSLYEKALDEDQRMYFKLQDELGEENMAKLAEVFATEHVPNNPEATLGDFNQFVLSIQMQGGE